jgi:RND family efflux transporter MFP subunit
MSGINMKITGNYWIGAIFSSAISLLIFGFFGCGERAETGVDKQTQPRDEKWVKVSPVTTLPPTGSIEYVGTLTANRRVKVASETGGTIEKLFFDKGDQVKEGQILAEISTTTMALEVRLAAAVLEEANAALSEAENNFKRVSNLYEINAVPDSQFDSAKRSAEMTRANKQKAEAALGLAEDKLRKSRLNAPCNGVVVFREVEEGEVIPPGTTLTEVIDLTRLKIKLSVNERDIYILEMHKQFKFAADAIPGQEFVSRLFFLSPTADPLTRSFPLELIVDDPDPRMADGMTVRVRLPVVDKRKAIKVPSAWLAEENGKIGLYVVKEGKALFKQVTLGGYYDQRVEILSGLDDQELIITNSAGLKSGEAVKY